MKDFQNDVLAEETLGKLLIFQNFKKCMHITQSKAELVVCQADDPGVCTLLALGQNSFWFHSFHSVPLCYLCSKQA